jgi:hypothetical protein
MLDMNIPDWVTDPSQYKNVSFEVHSDITAHARLKRDKHYFWTSGKIVNKFPQPWEEANLYFVAFPTSYLVESGFSLVIYLLSKYVTAVTF